MRVAQVRSTARVEGDLASHVEATEQAQDAPAAEPAPARASLGHDSCEARYAAVFSQSPLAMTINTFPEGTFVDANEAFLRLFEVRRDEVIGQGSTDLGLSDDALQDQVRAHLLEHGEVRELECSRTTRRGKPIWVALTVTPIDFDGQPHVLSMMRDLTDRRRLEGEARRERFLAEVGATLASTLDYDETVANIARLAVGEMGDLCVVEIIDEQGELRHQAIEFADPAKAPIAAAMRAAPLDAGRAHVVRAVLDNRQSIVLPEITPEVVDALAQLPEQRRIIEDIGARSAMGAPLIAHGEILGALFIGSCRPERVYTVNDLPLLEALAMRAALAVANARLHRRLKYAIHARDDILGIVAHDLRNPLAAVLMQASHLQVADPTSRAGRAAEGIRRAALRMNRLIEDLLDVARMDAGNLTIERVPVDARELVLEAVDAQRAVAAAAALELAVELPPELPALCADRDRVLQVLENLLGNALKFTPARGHITVSATVLPGELRLCVADTGPGVSAESLPHLFDRFWQARDHRHCGAGLGLAIAKGIVGAHGGRIWAESVPGRGATFCFTLPTGT